jgi:endonuclease YncB( thermonuclease family)
MQTQSLTYIRDSEIALYTLKNHISIAKVVRVVDGDTVYVVCYDRHGDLIKLNCRLFGIDTPEMTSAPEEAKRARNVLIGLVTNVVVSLDDMRSSRELQSVIDGNTRLIWVRFCGADKYGRELVEIYTRDGDAGQFELSVNARMIELGVARSYDGGAKTA